MRNSHVDVLRQPVESAPYASAQITKFAVANGITGSMGLTGICWVHQRDVRASSRP